MSAKSGSGKITLQTSVLESVYQAFDALHGDKTQGLSGEFSKKLSVLGVAVAELLTTSLEGFLKDFCKTFPGLEPSQPVPPLDIDRATLQSLAVFLRSQMKKTGMDSFPFALRVQRSLLEVHLNSDEPAAVFPLKYTRRSLVPCRLDRSWIAVPSDQIENLEKSTDVRELLYLPALCGSPETPWSATGSSELKHVFNLPLTVLKLSDHSRWAFDHVEPATCLLVNHQISKLQQSVGVLGNTRLPNGMSALVLDLVASHDSAQIAEVR